MTLRRPPSLAVPENVIVAPEEKEAPLEGEVMDEVGKVASVDCEAELNPDCRVPGCAPMSANKLTVACCISELTVVEPPQCSPSRPHDHCTVPAPNTNAPLE